MQGLYNETMLFNHILPDLKNQRYCEMIENGGDKIASEIVHSLSILPYKIYQDF
jgi:hypothetical protein